MRWLPSFLGSRPTMALLFGLAIASAPMTADAQSDSRDDSSATPSSISNDGIAVVELFTSQSCSSCPSADETLRRIASIASEKNLPVHVLSFHVDYWNYLQWNDPYSSAAYSDRQRSYARAMRSRRVYTPQMIVNGTTEFVGSNRKLANEAISDSLGEPAATTIDASLDASSSLETMVVRYKIHGNLAGQMIHLALVQSPEANAVPSGENSGRTLSHINVVRAFETAVIKHAEGEISIDVPAGVDADQATLIAYVQDQKTLQITGATSIN